MRVGEDDEWGWRAEEKKEEKEALGGLIFWDFKSRFFSAADVPDPKFSLVAAGGAGVGVHQMYRYWYQHVFIFRAFVCAGVSRAGLARPATARPRGMGWMDVPSVALYGTEKWLYERSESHARHAVVCA